jgi:hypothetical protein
VGLVFKHGCLLTLAYYAVPRWYEFGEWRWNDILTRDNQKTWRKTYPSATLSTTNPTRIDPGANPSLRGERPATNDLSHGMAQDLTVTLNGAENYSIYLCFRSASCTTDQKTVTVHVTLFTISPRNSNQQVCLHVHWDTLTLDAIICLCCEAVLISGNSLLEHWFFPWRRLRWWHDLLWPIPIHFFLTIQSRKPSLAL